MNNLIAQIKSQKEIGKVFSYVLGNLYRKGPVSVTDLEILSYLAYYCPKEFAQHRSTILNYMALFYKTTERNTFKDVIFMQYRRHIHETFQAYYTPVQADIVKGITDSKCFSFSAPTSTGKSYVFMRQIMEFKNDVIVIVPSRALINEYYLKLSDLIRDKRVNILTFIDKINTNHATRNVFIVTPERCRELFRIKDQFQVDLFLFDEAQLSDEDSKRGLYYDSIVRRCQKAFPKARYIFAHPFVQNPEAQVAKNHFDPATARSIQYTQKNVGQMFLCQDKEGKFHHFGVETSIMGRTRIPFEADPIANSINNGGTVLFYVTKRQIYNGKILEKFSKYISLCKEHPEEKIADYLNQLKEYTGGETTISQDHYSLLLDLLRKGIVVHHGSLPLNTRIIIEKFTNEGLCRICFATSTLEQGINMPFDVVFLDRLEGSKPLAVKNLIGRAGRSSLHSKFDYGFVIVNSPARMAAFRKIMTKDEILDNISLLEKPDQLDDDYNNFKEAILDGTYSDEFNLTEKDLVKLSTDSIDGIIEQILNVIFFNGELIELKQINIDLDFKLSFYSYFQSLYSLYLGRPLEDAEGYVLNTAIKIIFWKIYGKTFKNICWYRYAHASRSHERNKLKKEPNRVNKMMAAYITGYHELPDKNLNTYSLFPPETRAKDVSYDLIMYDTYDYIDKLIGFKLSDIFYAAFIKYHEKFQDSRAKKIALYIKYGTDSERVIWMMRYGMTLEDVIELDEHIESIGSEEIVFKSSISLVLDEKKVSIQRFIP
jgi:ATP-dependent RNA helicase DOB1